MGEIIMLNEKPEQQVEHEQLAKIGSWLNFAEINFLKVLDRAVANNAYIFTKVKVNDVLMKIESIDDLDDYDFGENTFDFVLCDKQDLSILCVIELDSRPHQMQTLCAENSYDSLCADFNIPLLEVPARCGYPIKELKKYLSLYVDMKCLDSA